MILMNDILIDKGLEITCMVIEIPVRRCKVITSLSGVGCTIETKPVWKKALTFDDNS